jgi:hypothetical protein
MKAKLLTCVALLAVAAATFGATSAVIDSGHSQASVHRVCIRIHHLRWCFGARSAKLAKAVKATYRADKTRSITMAPAGPHLFHAGEVTLTCTQPAPGAYDCSPTP